MDNPIVGTLITQEVYNKDCRFWDNTQAKESGCLEPTTAHGSPNGYKMTKRGGCSIMSHRYAYTLAIGPIPEGLYACHKCDNRACCNPEHIFIGTQSDNLIDSLRKGRRPTKLQDHDVVAIRKEYAAGRITLKALGEKYFVGETIIHNIVHRIKWAHVE